MGTYTELIFGAALKEDTPAEVIGTLRYLIQHVDCPNPQISDMRVVRGSSYYFGVNEAVSKMWFDKNSKQWHLSTRANCKNYEGEIENFLAWIKPHVESGSGENEMYAITICETDAEPKIYYLNSD